MNENFSPQSQKTATESATRKEIIDVRLREAGWNTSDRTQVTEEFSIAPAGEDAPLTSSTGQNLIVASAQGFSDYVLLGVLLQTAGPG